MHVQKIKTFNKSLIVSPQPTRSCSLMLIRCDDTHRAGNATWRRGGVGGLLPRTLMMIRCVNQQPDCTQFTRPARGASILPSHPLWDDTETWTPSSTHPHRRNVGSDVASLSQSQGLPVILISIFMKTSIIRHLVLSQRAKTIQTAAGLSPTWSRSPPAAGGQISPF